MHRKRKLFLEAISVTTRFKKTGLGFVTEERFLAKVRIAELQLR